MLLLASGSPRRKELLEQLGLSFEVGPSDIDETPNVDELPSSYVERMAREKLRAACLSWSGVALAADTSVVLDGRVLGKPKHDEDNLAMLRALSGRTHVVMTAVAVGGPDGPLHLRRCDTKVCFAELGESMIRRYVERGEGRDKAGGYAIQGLGGGFVEAIEGSYSNVVGLPLHDVLALLRAAGAIGEWP